MRELPGCLAEVAPYALAADGIFRDQHNLTRRESQGESYYFSICFRSFLSFRDCIDPRRETASCMSSIILLSTALSGLFTSNAVCVSP